jgi:NAD-dependent dihydropyrimidine dehydrogenase PreA subunit
MRDDATFIGIELDDAVVDDAELAQGLEDACPVDIFKNAGGRVEIVHENVDECILCELCIQASPPGTVKVHKLYSGEVLGASSG